MTTSVCPQKNFDVFSDMDEADLQYIQQYAQVKVYKPGQYIFHADGARDHVHRIDRGCVIAERFSGKGDRQVMAFLFTNNFIGYFEQLNYNLAMKCVSDTAVTFYSKDVFSGFVERFPQLRSNMEKVARRITAMTLEYMSVMGHRNAEEKVCFFLHQLLIRCPNADLERIFIPVPRQDIADHLGITSETVCRAITRLRLRKIIRLIKTNEVQILDYDALQAMFD